MRILEVHIDGFGIFAGRHIRGFTTGINLFYGGNEFGKTTLLSFIRRILFGFPRSSASTNPYPALFGGAYGGRLICQLKNGENVTISRTLGRRAALVTISTATGQLSGQDELDKLLGHLNGTFYENVYAISLEELQEIGSLQGDEVRSQIYGAGLGLGSISLPDIRSEFTTRSESLYKPTGRKQTMLTLLQGIRDLEKQASTIEEGLVNYDGLVSGREELENKVRKLEGQLSDLRVLQKSLENKKTLFPVYLDYEEAAAKLSKLGKAPDFPEDALQNLELKKTAIADLERLIDENSAELNGLESEKKRMVYNDRILASEEHVVALQRLSEKYRAAVDDIEGVKVKRTALESQTTKNISQIGEMWNISRITNFNPNHVQKDKILLYASSFDQARVRLDDARNKLDYHKEQKAAASPKQLPTRAFPKYAVYLIILLSLCATVLGFLTSYWWLALPCVFTMFVGLFVVLKIRQSSRTELTDPLQNELAERLERERLEYQRLDSEWREFLRGIGFDEDLSPKGANEVISAIQKIQLDIATLDELDSRIARMQNTIDNVKALHEQVAPYVERSYITTDISANIPVFATHLDSAKTAKLRSQDLGERIRKLHDRIANLRNDKEKLEGEILTYISSRGASDEADFRQKFAVFVERRQLLQNANACRKNIQMVVGTGEHFDSFLASISSTQPDMIPPQLEEIQRHLTELSNERDQTNISIGEAKKEIERLSSSNDLQVKQSEVELKKQELRDCSRDWVKSQIGQLMLDKAISKYEETRQPDVIKAAENFFLHVAGTNYSAIIKPIDSDEFEIRDSTGRSKSILEMSRGTREQLYLAMRLGLIEEYEKRSEPMPVVMDDILANFDDDRVRLAIQALKSFSETRQIIVLTCHKNNLDLYQQAGATLLSLE